jgi:hypothetical protein
MATELVVLSDIPFTEELVLATALQVIPDGAGLSFRDGEITQFVDSNADPVLTMFDTTVVHDPADARALLKDPPVSFALWTEFIPRHPQHRPRHHPPRHPGQTRNHRLRHTRTRDRQDKA